MCGSKQHRVANICNIVGQPFFLKDKSNLKCDVADDIFSVKCNDKKWARHRSKANYYQTSTLAPQFLHPVLMQKTSTLHKIQPCLTDVVIFDTVSLMRIHITSYFFKHISSSSSQMILLNRHDNTMRGLNISINCKTDKLHESYLFVSLQISVLVS